MRHVSLGVNLSFRMISHPWIHWKRIFDPKSVLGVSIRGSEEKMHQITMESIGAYRFY